MNILCVDTGGNTRAVACATALKRRGQNAIGAGWHHNAPEPIATLSRWAERILIMYHWTPDFIPEAERHKIRYLDVGHDVWHDPTNPQLVAMIQNALNQWQAAGFP